MQCRGELDKVGGAMASLLISEVCGAALWLGEGDEMAVRECNCRVRAELALLGRPFGGARNVG